MNILIFDTETIGPMTQEAINLGYMVVDLNIQNATYKVLQKRDYIDTKLINNKVFCLNDTFVGQAKYDKFMEALKTKETKKVPMRRAFNTLLNDIKRYNVLFAYAFNCNFDIRVLSKYGEFPIPVFDIQSYCYDYIFQTQAYQDFCKENDLVTPSQQYLQRNVESICKYLYNMVDFTEDHTSLSDVSHETNILVECVKRGADITRAGSQVKNLASGKVLTFTYKVGDIVTTINYKTSYTKNGVTTFKE